MAFDDNHLPHIMNFDVFPAFGRFATSTSGFDDIRLASGFEDIDAGVVSGTASIAGVGAPCALQSGLVADTLILPILTQFLGGNSVGCTTVALNISANLVFPPLQQTLGAPATWSMGPAIFRGPRLVATFDPAAQRRRGPVAGLRRRLPTRRGG
jgi:hypothetical protein